MLVPELHRRAIAVVARLSIFAGVAGCAGTVVTESDTDGDPGTGDDAPSDTGETDETGGDDGPVVSFDPAVPACTADAVNTACCETVLLATFADPDFSWNTANATDQEKACCELMVGIADEWPLGEQLPFDSSITQVCCTSGLVEGGWEEHPTCTPWGPPMPPHMPRRLARPRAAIAAEVVS